MFRHVAAIVISVSSMLAIACQPGRTPAPAPTPLAPPSPSPAPDLGQGIDVSSHNGDVDWGQVRAAGYTFGIVKASEGVDLQDPSYQDHWRGLTDAGLVRGAYHFYVTEDDPEQQAALFLDTARLRPGDLAPIVDIELIGHGTAPGLEARLQRFLDILEQHHGVPPILYTSPNFAGEHLGPEFARYPLWIAEYGADQPRLPDAWDTWHLWQHTDDAEIPGVDTHADVSRVNPELDNSRLLIPRSNPVTAPDPTG